jgi:Ca-activated chloride channel family protein
VPVADFAKQIQAAPGQAAQSRAEEAQKAFDKLGDVKNEKDGVGKALSEAKQRWAYNNAAYSYLRQGQKEAVQTGGLGVDLSLQSNLLRNQDRLCNSAVRRVQNRNCLEVGGVWIDEGYDPKMKTVAVKPMSKAYFRILARHPEARDVFRLGNHLVWVTPSGAALVVDTSAGREELPDREIDALFAAKK